MTRSTSPTSRLALVRPLALAAVLAACVPLLQGCFPMVAAGAGGAVLSALDRRTSGTQVEDEGIELRAGARLREKLGNRANINVTSYNRNVLLTGQVADEATRSEAIGHPGRRAECARRQQRDRDRRRVIPDAALERCAHHLEGEGTPARRPARIRQSREGRHRNEQGVPHGAADRNGSKAAKEIAAATGGVSKVVAIIEIVTPEEARRLDQAGGGR
jgi:hypothetical protein